MASGTGDALRDAGNAGAEAGEGGHLAPGGLVALRAFGGLTALT